MVERVELRRVGENDLPIIEKLTQDPAVSGEFAWFGWYDTQVRKSGNRTSCSPPTAEH
jgi:hypothetical protein